MSYDFLMVSELDNKNNTLRKYIYLEKNNMIYKFEIKFNHIDIVNSIEEYMEIINDCDFIVKSESELSTEGLIKNYLPFQGKYRLKGNYRATNNYLVPCDTRLLKVLLSIHNSGILEEINLLKLKNEYKLAYEENNKLVKEFIVKFLLKANFSLIEVFSIEEIKQCLNCLDRISSETKYSRTHLHLSKILSNSKQNASCFDLFGIDYEFVDSTKESVDDEEFDNVVAKANEPFYKIYNKHN